MTEDRGPVGPQFHADRPKEQEAVRTTIVGGRPPGSGQPLGNIPRGIEVLVKKAAVDPEFKAILLDRRAAAADEIGLELEPAEAAMLAAAPREQLEAIIASTHVPEEHRRAFLGKAAAAMLIAVGATAAISMCLSAGSRARGKANEVKGIRPDRPISKGIQPDRPEKPESKSEPKPAQSPNDPPHPSTETRSES
jgi:hypothetical protein